MNEPTRQLLEKLANELGTTADHLWQVLIKQAPISAISHLIVSFVCIAISLLFVRFGIKKYKETDNDELYIPIIITFSLVSIVALIMFIINLPNLFTVIFNPEYWALREIMRFLR